MRPLLSGGTVGGRLALSIGRETLRFQIRATPSLLVVTATPPGFRWPVVLRILVVCTFGLPLIGDPRTLPWPSQAFWLLMAVALLAFLIHTLRLARTRSRLGLDRKTATLVSTTAFGSRSYSCALHELQLGPVRLLHSEEAEDGAETFCLELRFGPQHVEAFATHDESELSLIRSRLVDWLNPSLLRVAGSNDSQRFAQPTP